jgi:hypothetical protein
MKKVLGAAVAAVFVLSISASSASAQGFTAFSLIGHASIVSYCENRELTKEEAAGTAIGFSSVWKAMRDCQANRAKMQAAQAAPSAKKK